MKIINSTVWRNKDGKWLILRQRHTHTGHRIDVEHTDNIEEATPMSHLPLFLCQIA